MSERQKSALFHTGILPAGQTIHLAIAGDKFFLDVSNGPLHIQADTGHDILYYSGMGLRFDRDKTPFKNLRVKNNNTFSVFFQLFAGFDDLDDRRTFYPSLQFKQIVNSVYDFSADAPDADIDIPDLSGTTITYDGVEYYAVNRQLLYVFNGHDTIGIYIENPAGRKIGSIAPYGAIQIPLTGDLVATHAGAAPIISELYNCLPLPT